MNDRYADLLVSYSLNVQSGQRVLIRASSLATPLVQSVYQRLLEKGALVETLMSFENQERLFYDFASDQQLDSVSSFYALAVENFDAIISLISPFNLKSTASVAQEKKKRAQEALAPVRKLLMQRSAKKDLKWVLAVYPTQSAAQEAGLSLSEYERFVHKACMLHTDDPIASWNAVSAAQEVVASKLNTVRKVIYKGPETELSFSTNGRTWINSDGHYNMPSGEVFSSPVENSVNGEIFFDVPTVYDGQDVSGISLVVRDGLIVDWDAVVGKAVLDRVFSIDGARYFGEVAIGTNYSINTATKNILFDEKMGGCIHMAVGASYPETGGLNESAVHWDMIKHMDDGGQIWVDDELIYENGTFLLSEAADLKTVFK